MKKPSTLWIYLVIGCGLLGILIFIFPLILTNNHKIKPHKIQYGHQNYQDIDSIIEFDLVDPEQAPADLKPLVMQGYHVMLATQFYATEYAGDILNCTNCHFSAGNTSGGPNNGISLVGVTKTYPRKMKNGQIEDLADRINACFEKSLNGKPMPKDDPLMLAMLAYLEWISKDVKALTPYPWLGLKELKSEHLPDKINGSIIYTNTCSECHGEDGEGKAHHEDLSTPPLWGNASFNDAAGMNKLSKLSSFIYLNMPYDGIGLTQEEAIDVAAFIITQSRPHRLTSD